MLVKTIKYRLNQEEQCLHLSCILLELLELSIWLISWLNHKEITSNQKQTPSQTKNIYNEEFFCIVLKDIEIELWKLVSIYKN